MQQYTLPTEGGWEGWFPYPVEPKPEPTPTPTPPEPEPIPEPAPLPVYNTDPNSNLREAVFRGNEENTAAINQFAQLANQYTNQYGQATGAQTKGTNQQMNQAFSGYDERARGLLGAMGTADPATLARYRGNAYAGLDSGFSNAGDSLQASMAQRGLSGSGIFAQNMGNLAQNRMAAGAQAGTNAYSQAIGASDATRATQLGGEGNLYGAQQADILGGFNRNMGQLGQMYGTQMAVQGQGLQNTLNNAQQRQANLMGYSQLGRGMSGMANNYLSQAGTGYGQIGGQAGQTAVGLGSNQVAYNTGMNSAQANMTDNSAKGAGFGALGSLGSAAIQYSDKKLKENLAPIVEIMDGITLYRWTWTDEAEALVGNAPTVGVIAQEVQKVMPEAVSINEETGYLQVNYSMVFKGAKDG